MLDLINIPCRTRPAVEAVVRRAEADGWHVDEVRAMADAVAREMGRLRNQATAARVDGDQRVEAALRRSEDCETHGAEIQHWRHVAGASAASARALDGIRDHFVRLMIVTQQRAGAADSVPGARLAAWLGQFVDALSASRVKVRFPSFADCARAGGCDHDDAPVEVLTAAESA